MNVTLVQTDVQLPEDPLVELVLIQWHTSAPDVSPMSPDESAYKAETLHRVAEWLGNRTPADVGRPLLVVTPELSTPIEHESLLVDLVHRSPQPTVVIAGIEYFSWEDYVDRLEHSDQPAFEQDLAQGDAALRVNAAMILVRGEQGAVKTYWQPKLNPADPEHIYRGTRALLFHSADSTPGRRLNFSVHICADFTHAEVVTEFRKECVNTLPAAALDLAFLLQLNPDQHRIEFKQGVQAFYATPKGKLPTSHSCLVALNNASPELGLSKEWGRSRLQYSWAARWRRGPPRHTYWLRSESEFNHQSVTLRENGPGVYRLLVRPRELVDDAPGKGEAHPFVADEASFAPLPADAWNGYTLGDELEGIPPVGHWMLTHWRDHTVSMKAQLDQNKVASAVAEVVCEAANAAIEEWDAHLSLSDLEAQRAMSAYLVCFRGNDGYPGGELGEPEPKLWCPTVTVGVRKLLDAFGLLQLVSEGMGAKLSAAVSGVAQAKCKALGQVSFVWGGSSASARRMLTQFHEMQGAEAPGGMAAPKHLVVLVDPEDNPDPKALADTLDDSLTRVTDELPESLPEHLHPPGGVVDPEQERIVSCLIQRSLTSAVTGSNTEAELRASLLGTVS